MHRENIDPENHVQIAVEGPPDDKGADHVAGTFFVCQSQIMRMVSME